VNIVAGFCIVCGNSIPEPLRCRACGQSCEARAYGTPDPTVFNALSVCHGADVDVRTTCSEEHHELLVEQTVAAFGAVKKVVDSATGKAYAVPTRDIIEKGLRWADLPDYPEWRELR
jgi:hypothetical protein